MSTPTAFRRMPNKTTVIFAFAAVLLTACVVDELKIVPIAVTEQTDARVTSAVKAHLVDGSTVVFQQGFWVKGGDIVGTGEQYDITLKKRMPIASIRVQDVAAMESYQLEVDKVATSLATGVVGSASIFSGALLFKAIFGSCPTTYTFADGEPSLEAESFSYAVVPRLESRDVDRLGVTKVGNDLVLEVRNEALETHYINQLELLEVTHDSSHVAYPDADGKIVLTHSSVAPVSAKESTGRDIWSLLDKSDGVAWKATDERLASMTPDDLLDHIDLEFDMPETDVDVALLLRFRNSLLNTVFFYDVMLKGLGFEALDWMGDQTPTMDMLKSARWYQEKMGMKVSVWRNNRYREVAHIDDQGPIAWKDIAIPLEAPGPKVRVRLSFISDNWRIDWARVANMQYVRPKTISVSDVLDSEKRGEIIPSLAKADSRYLVTRPGEKVRLQFLVGEPPDNATRTYFLAANGYYVEWMRRDWLSGGPATAGSATASDAAVWEAIQLWRNKRDSFRQQFENTRIAVR